MKCPNCGGTEFRKIDKLFELHCWDCCVSVENHVEAYGCINCGRVEIYMPNSWANGILLAEKKAEEEKNAIEEKQAIIDSLNKKISELEFVAFDDNSTLKQAREAKSEIEKVAAELDKAKAELKKLTANSKK